MKGRIVVALIVGFIIGIVAGVGIGRFRNKTDVMSKATPAKKDTAVTLPKPGETYEVLGVIDGLKKFVVKYDDKVIRGGEFTAEEGAKYLQKQGVKTVLSVTPTDLERLICEKYKFELVEVPYEKKPGVSKETYDKILDAFKNKEGLFYLHCHGGTHRGGILGTIYRVKILGWDIEKAKKEYDALGGDPDNKDKGMFEGVLDLMKE